MTLTKPGYKLHSRRKSTQVPRWWRIQPFLWKKCSSLSSLDLHSLEGSRPPAVLRLLTGSLNQNPICVYFLFSAGSTPRLLLRWPGSVLVCAHAFSQATPWMCPCASFFTGRRRNGVSGVGETTCSAASFLRCVLLCTAPLCQATDIHGVDYETKEGGSRGAPQTPLYRLGRDTLPSTSQFSHKILTQKWRPPTRALSPSLSLGPIFVRLFSPSVFLLVFEFLEKWSGLAC